MDMGTSTMNMGSMATATGAAASATTSMTMSMSSMGGDCQISVSLEVQPFHHNNNWFRTVDALELVHPWCLFVKSFPWHFFVILADWAKASFPHHGMSPRAACSLAPASASSCLSCLSSSCVGPRKNMIATSSDKPNLSSSNNNPPNTCRDPSVIMGPLKPLLLLLQLRLLAQMYADSDQMSSSNSSGQCSTCCNSLWHILSCYWLCTTTDILSSVSSLVHFLGHLSSAGRLLVCCKSSGRISDICLLKFYWTGRTKGERRHTVAVRDILKRVEENFPATHFSFQVRCWEVSSNFWITIPRLKHKITSTPQSINSPHYHNTCNTSACTWIATGTTAQCGESVLCREEMQDMAQLPISLMGTRNCSSVLRKEQRSSGAFLFPRPPIEVDWGRLRTMMNHVGRGGLAEWVSGANFLNNDLEIGICMENGEGPPTFYHFHCLITGMPYLLLRWD